jgi:PHD/YefM family antitoxin component YafN of YafNO toxin-antitoxin module
VNDPHDPPAIAPRAHEHIEQLRRRREMLSRLQQMLEVYWLNLKEQAEPLAEEILERASKEAALHSV